MLADAFGQGGWGVSILEVLTNHRSGKQLLGVMPLRRRGINMTSSGMDTREGNVHIANRVLTEYIRGNACLFTEGACYEMSSPLS